MAHTHPVDDLKDMDVEETTWTTELISRWSELTLARRLQLTISLILAVGASSFFLYTSYFGVLEAWQHRAITLSFFLVLAFLTTSSHPKGGTDRSPALWKAFDGLCLVLAIALSLYTYLDYPGIILREGWPNRLDLFFGTIAVLLVLEATRRVAGRAIVLTTLPFLLYAYFGRYIPGILGHPGFDFEKIVDTMFNTTYGIFGLILGTFSTFIIIFIIFGAFLSLSGMGKILLDLAFAVAGRFSGGPAKVAVVASGLMGMVSGAGAANVVTTGTFTIPLMKRVGYRSEFAGGVEAAASIGGQIMPPVMGAAAFLIAEYTRTPYSQLMVHALIPALLHFVAVGFMVHFEASRLGLVGLPREGLPNLRDALRNGFHMLIPIAAIIYLLLEGYTPQRAGFIAIALTFALSLLNPKTRMTPVRIMGALERGARNALPLAMIVACAGILVGTVTMTGLGLKLSSLVIKAAGGHMLFGLILTMVASLVLGMGMPTVSAYVILAVLAVPALIQLGTPPIAAHLFVFYFGIMSNVTPPVAVTAYAAAAIAQADQTRTALSGLKLSLASFIVPYMFVYGPALLWQGSPAEIALAALTATIGVAALAAALQGWFLTRFSPWERTIAFCAAVLLINPGLATDAIGLALAGFVVARQLAALRMREGGTVSHLGRPVEQTVLSIRKGE